MTTTATRPMPAGWSFARVGEYDRYGHIDCAVEDEAAIYGVEIVSFGARRVNDGLVCVDHIVCIDCGCDTEVEYFDFDPEEYEPEEER